MSALYFLQSLDAKSIILLFWYTTLLEIPRYLIGALVTTAVAIWSRPARAVVSDLTLSVAIVGHNERRPLRACVEALAEQTILSAGVVMQVVVVDDGSTDRMIEVGRALQREGKIDRLLRLEHRSGKSAGVNLALSACRGDIVIIADVDTTFDRDAFAEILAYFADPTVGAVSGNLGVRNLSASLMTRVQGIEYSIGFSLGRRIADALGILSIVSGAFGAFRRAALEQVGRQDVEVGEDADLTMKLRRAGWRIRFAPEANGLTIVPETVTSLIAQRLRWDRGLVTIWLRKFRGAFDPRQSTFRLLDMFSVIDVLIFQVVLALAFPGYLIWLYYYFGSFAITIVGATLLGYAAINFFAFFAAAAVGIQVPFWLVFYLPLYTVLHITVMRAVRLVAIVQEIVFRSSYRDLYVPSHVMRQVDVI
jgi:cellulose synthase/poly-beta-1,6-N-acetylglucosamine synthase-like glycosyltransferase